MLLTTDDVQADYEQLLARGVEFTEAPEERPYGIDTAFRDPSGNQFRLTQVRNPVPAWRLRRPWKLGRARHSGGSSQEPPPGSAPDR